MIENTKTMDDFKALIGIREFMESALSVFTGYFKLFNCANCFLREVNSSDGGSIVSIKL